VDFTVVVPTFNRPEELAGCLRALSALEYARDAYEVLIVDDGGCVDLTQALHCAAPTMRTRVLRQANRGPGAARNTGAMEAEGRWLAFTDDDCRPHVEWLCELKAELEQGEDVLAGGRTENQLSQNMFSVASQVVADAAYRYYNPDRRAGRFLASNNMGVWRASLLAVGGFDERIRPASEDRDLCDRWTWRGGRIVWTDQAVVGHCHDLTLSSFLRQHYQYGQGAARFHSARRARGTGRIWDDMSLRWQWVDLLLKPALSTERPLATLALLACWQAANTAGFLNATLSGTWRRS